MKNRLLELSIGDVTGITEFDISMLVANNDVPPINFRHGSLCGSMVPIPGPTLTILAIHIQLVDWLTSTMMKAL